MPPYLPVTIYDPPLRFKIFPTYFLVARFNPYAGDYETHRILSLPEARARYPDIFERAEALVQTPFDSSEPRDLAESLASLKISSSVV